LNYTLRPVDCVIKGRKNDSNIIGSSMLFPILIKI
jgi:hypothetical protein